MRLPRIFTTLLCASIVAFAGAPATAVAAELYARVVDTGNALCVIIQIPDDHFILYDAVNYKKPNGECRSGVQRIVGNDRLDLIVVSHSDADHLGELADILKAYQGRVDRLVCTGRPGTSTQVWPAALKAIEALDDKGASAPLRIVRNLGIEPLPHIYDPSATPWSISYGDAKVTFVAGWRDWPPPYGELEPKDSALNNIVSIVLRVDYGGKSILLTGDTIGRNGKED